MVTEELIAYIRSQLDAGMNRDEIVKTLKTQGGWATGDVAEAFARIGQEKAPDKGAVKVRKSEEQPQDPAVGAQINDQVTGQIAQATQVTSNETVESHASDSILGQVAEQEKGSVGKKIVSTIIVIIVLSGVCAGGAYGYFTYLRNPKAHDILSETITKSMEVTSAREKGDLKMNFNVSVDTGGGSAIQNFLTDDEVSIDYNVSYDLKYDISDAANQKVDGSIILGFEGGMGIVKVNFEGTADLKMVDNIVYVRLRDTTPFMEFDLTEYEDRWIEIDMENIMPGVGIDIEELMAMQSEQQEEVMKVLKEFLDDPEVIKIINRSASVKNATDSNSASEYYITVQVSKDDWIILTKKAIEVFKDLAASMMEEQMQGMSQLPEGFDHSDSNEEMDEAFAEIETQLNSEEAQKVFEVLEKLTIDMWITKDTMLTRRSTISLNAEGVTIEDEYQKATLDIDVLGEVEREYGVSVEVTPPMDATPVQEFIEEVSEGMFGEAQRKGGEAAVKANLMTTRVQAELYYDDNGNSYGTPVIASSEACSALDTMFEDGTIKNSLESTVNAISTGVVVCAIGTDGQSWVISFNDPVYDWSWCVDSTGYSGESDILETGGENSEAKCNNEKFEEDFGAIDW